MYICIQTCMYVRMYVYMYYHSMSTKISMIYCYIINWSILWTSHHLINRNIFLIHELHTYIIICSYICVCMYKYRYVNILWLPQIVSYLVVVFQLNIFLTSIDTPPNNWSQVHKIHLDSFSNYPLMQEWEWDYS